MGEAEQVKKVVAALLGFEWRYSGLVICFYAGETQPVGHILRRSGNRNYKRNWIAYSARLRTREYFETESLAKSWVEENA